MLRRHSIALPLLGLLLLAVPADAGAQWRSAETVPALGPGQLAAHLASSQGAVSSCAGRADTDAYLAEVRASVAPGPAPSTMFNARIRVTVRSRPRDHALERCVRRVVEDRLRHQSEAVRRTVRSRHTFRIADRPPAPRPRLRPSYSDAHARAALSRVERSLQRCVGPGMGASVTLQVTVDRAGRLALTHANLPAGADPRALGCMASAVGHARLTSEPPRGRVRLRHTLTLR